MKLRSIIAAPIAIVAAGLLLSACGQASQIPGAATISPAAAAATVSSAAASSPVDQAKSSAPAALAEVGTFGQVLVGANGNTLYAFTKDVDGVSTCFDACAAAWPAVIVTPGFAPPAGVDPSLVTTVDRPDGSKQLKIGKWPLYFYAGDGAPGESNGQGVGGVWFVEGADGKLVKGDAPAAGAEAPSAAADPAPIDADPAEEADDPADADSTEGAADPADADSAEEAADPAAPVVSLAQVGNLGEVMVGANGHTLYAFTNDPEKQSTCVDACAEAWPPLTVEDGFTISDELQASGASVIERTDGTKQLAMGKWALYYYAGDGAPGEANGQGINGKWFAVDGQCKLVKTDA